MVVKVSWPRCMVVPATVDTAVMGNGVWRSLRKVRLAVNPHYYGLDVGLSVLHVS